MLPDFNRLKVFYFIYHLGSVQKAAQELHVTQSAISQNLLKLEEELNHSLFTRVHKKLVPTAEADSLYELLAPFVNELEKEVEQIQHSKSTPCGELKIGAPEEFGQRYLLQVCSRFQQIHPQVSFQIKTGHPTFLLPEVEKGGLDFSFADIFINSKSKPQSYITLDIQEVFREELVLTCSQQYYSDTFPVTPNLQALTNASYVCYQAHAPEIKTWFQHYFKTSAIKVKNSLTIESVRGVISGIKQGMGLGIVPSHLIRLELQKGLLIPIKPKGKEIISSISLVRLQDKKQNLSEKLFIDFFKEELTLQTSPP